MGLLPASYRSPQAKQYGEADIYRNLVLPNILAGNNRQQTILDAVAQEKALLEARRVAADLSPTNTSAHKRQQLRERMQAAADAARERARKAREERQQMLEQRRQITQQRQGDAFRDQLRQQALQMIGGF